MSDPIARLNAALEGRYAIVGGDCSLTQINGDSDGRPRLGRTP